MNLFNRYLKVDLIRDNESSEELVRLVKGLNDAGAGGTVSNSGYIDTIKVFDRLEVSQELKTEVVINTSKESGTNSGSVKIYNPNARTLRFIQPNKGGIIEITAGYKEKNGMIWRGAVGGSNEIKIERSGTDIIMTLQLGDYTSRIANAFFRRSFEGQHTSESIIRSALSFARIPHVGLHNAFIVKSHDKRTNEQILTDLLAGKDSRYREMPLTDFSWSGKVTDLIDHMLKERGLSAIGIKAYVKNGYFIFTNEAVLEKTTIHVINADTGLIDVPRWKLVDNKPVFTFESMMDCDIGTESIVEIQSLVDPAINGMYSVEKVDYDLSNYDGEFSIKAEAVQRKVITKEPLET